MGRAVGVRRGGRVAVVNRAKGSRSFAFGDSIDSDPCRVGSRPLGVML
jgi:hypothetical protein